MTAYLLTALNVTSKIEGREWRFDGGRFRWVGFESRERYSPTIGEGRENERGEWEHFEYREGRLVLELDDGVDVADGQRAVDALSGLIDLYAGPWGMQLTLLELPDEMADAAIIVEEDLADELNRHAFAQPTHMVGTGAMYIDESGPIWSLERVETVLRDADAGGGLLAALVFLFVSQLEFAFLGDDVRWVLGLEGDEDAPQSAVDRVRVEESFHNCFKALEALLGGEPPKDTRRLRARLAAVGVDTVKSSGFPGRPQETMIERIGRLHETRDKRSAHGGNTGVASRKITFFELMDAQQATGLAIYESIETALAAAAT
jgi:hypothetical protein